MFPRTPTLVKLISEWPRSRTTAWTAWLCSTTRRSLRMQSSNTWTSPATGDKWAIEFGFTNMNPSGYDDVYYTLFTVVGGQGA